MNAWAMVGLIRQKILSLHFLIGKNKLANDSLDTLHLDLRMKHIFLFGNILYEVVLFAPWVEQREYPHQNHKYSLLNDYGHYTFVIRFDGLTTCPNISQRVY